jgi:hypothetical protein
MMLAEPVPPDAMVLVDGDGRIVGFEWSAMPEARYIEIRRRSPEDARARLLSSPLPPDLAQALADETCPENS